MIVSKKQITTLLLLLGLIVGIFLTIYLVKQRQEIRPRALQGKANLLLSAGNTSPKVGDSFDVLVSLQLTDASLQVSGADVTLLYDKSRLQVISILPQVPSVDPGAAFTDAPIVTFGGVFDDSFNFARVSLVARKTTANLAKGTVSLARVTFKSLNTGTATIKFPDDDNLLQIVGYGLGIPTVIPPSVTPIISTTPSPTGGATVGLWHMDEASGNVIDSSGNGNTGISTGTTVVAGKMGNARSFDGSSYITMSAGSGTSLDMDSGAITLEAWFNPTQTDNNQSLVSRGVAYTNGYYMSLRSDGRIACVGSTDIYSSTNLYVANQWQYAACVINGANSVLYYNGTEVARGTVNIGASSRDVYIGKTEYPNEGSYTDYNSGKVDEVHISNIALSAAEILANYQVQNGITPTPTPSPTGPTLTPSPTPAGGVNVHGFIFKEITPNGFKGPDETVLSGASLKIEKLEGDGTYTDKGTVISDNENVVKNFTFNGMTAGSYKIDPPQVAGYTVESCDMISNPIPTPYPWFSNVGNYFYCLRADGNYRLKQWISTSQYQQDADNLFNVGNQDVGIDFPMRPAQ